MRLSEDFLIRSEGGGQVLLECIARYRQLGRLFSAPRPLRWPAVLQRTQEIIRAEAKADQARVRVKLVNRAEAGSLLERFAGERERLSSAIGAELTQSGVDPSTGLAARLGELETVSLEQEAYASLHQGFRLQRRAWVAALLTSALLVPAVAWAWASDLGQVPTRFALGALVTAPPGLLALTGWAAAVAMTGQVLARASWLGSQSPRLRIPALAAGVAAAAAVFPLGGWELALSSAAVAALLCASGQVVRAAWS